MKKLYTELLLLFIVFPIVLAIPSIHYSIKVIFGILAFAYICTISIKHKYYLQKNNLFNYYSILPKFLGIALTSTIYLYFTEPNSLFIAIKSKPLIWLLFLGIYTLLSVLPQEFIYRTWFFKRYQNLIDSSTIFIILNAFIFSLGHLFFWSPLVLLITFIGGLLFASTYQNTKSFWLVSIEHTIYGGWLFTVGFGKLLGFPI
ncbi:CPBP family intramembrane metalloprotease [Flavobacteriaceae bacterium]|nr:CPBP family intramembrane metalloprotease [Flavobacteriaceae bacterium]